MHSIITLYIKELRPSSTHPQLFLNVYGKPLGQGEASRCLTRYFEPFGLQLSGVTTLRKVLSNCYCDAFADGSITQQGKCTRVYTIFVMLHIINHHVLVYYF